MSDHVFICYAREDEQFVLALAQHLKVRRIPIWLDQWNVPPGANWNNSIDDALYDCERVLLVLSPAAVKSERVQGEWVTALEEKKPIVPVIFQECRVPSRLRLLQRIDLIAKGLEDTISLNRLVVTLSEKRSATLAPPTVPEVSLPTQQEAPLQPDIIQPPQESAPSTILDPIFRNNSGMDFVLIPAGEFQMGSESGTDEEKPVHLVRITQPFYIGKYLVTQAQWEKVMGNNLSHFAGNTNCPVENVSWDEVQVFLQQVKERDGKPYRLPTEAEWEYAARAGSTGAYCFGDDPQLLRKYAWYEENSGNTTHPVGQLNANGWNLYDMHGNVWEWVQDWYDEGYYQKSPTGDPEGPSKGEGRVLRGGSWGSEERYLCVSYRYWRDLGGRSNRIGFRVVVLPKL